MNIQQATAMFNAIEEADIKRKAREEDRFKNWMAKVDILLDESFGGLTSEDLPDRDYAGMFESGTTPEEVVDGCFEEEDLDW